mgnify:FL=1
MEELGYSDVSQLPQLELITWDTSEQKLLLETIIDQWQSQIFARLLLKATVVFVSSCDDQLVEDLHMVPAHSMEEALEKAKAIVKKDDYKVTVIPDGVSVIVRE